MERLTQWSIDEWKGTLSSALLGSFTTSNDGLPDNFTFKSATTIVQPINLKDLFVNDSICRLHQFLTLAHKSEFDKASIHDILNDPLFDDPIIDDAFVTFGVVE